MNEISIIVAMTKGRVIGRNNSIPWHIPEDLKLFKKITTGGVVIMGRKTFQSVGKPLTNRENIVVSRTLEKRAGIILCPSVDKAMERAKRSGKPIFIIGGAAIYKQLFPFASKLFISHIHGDYSGDTFFPEINMEEWEKVEENRFSDFTQKVYRKKTLS